MYLLEHTLNKKLASWGLEDEQVGALLSGALD
jgi:hypothetical protein